VEKRQWEVTEIGVGKGQGGPSCKKRKTEGREDRPRRSVATTKATPKGRKRNPTGRDIHLGGKEPKKIESTTKEREEKGHLIKLFEGIKGESLQNET